MITITATEMARRLSAILDESKKGKSFEIMRGGEHVGTLMPPHHANGAAIITAYGGTRLDETTDETLAEVHRSMNVPIEIEDPWGDD